MVALAFVLNNLCRNSLCIEDNASYNSHHNLYFSPTSPQSLATTTVAAIAK